MSRSTGIIGLATLLTLSALTASAAAVPEPVRTLVDGGMTNASRLESTASLKPRVIDKPIPFGRHRQIQMERYSKRHYGHRESRLIRPRVIVEHYTDGPTMMSAWWTMANNTKNLDEFPGVCTHFIVDTDGRIFRTVPLQLRCRHTIGLNQTAIGIEHVGFSDHQVMRNDPQRRASLRLTLWLMARFNIPAKNVIGHGESLLSPYRFELYRSWKCLTHTDFSHLTMNRYRDRLQARARTHGVRVGPRPAWVDIGC